MLSLSSDEINEMRGSDVGEDNDAMSNLGEESVEKGGESISHLDPNKTRVTVMQPMLMCPICLLSLLLLLVLLLLLPLPPITRCRIQKR
jgi:hypothetical protein